LPARPPVVIIQSQEALTRVEERTAWLFLSTGRNHTMEEAGRKLKRARERLDLRYRDVEQASLRIAERHKSDEFA